jgi:hypothetical protein
MMDRQINYPGQVPLETDLLQSNQNVMIGLAKLSQAIFGTAGMATGFGTTQTVVPSLNVLVAPGEVYIQQNLEATAISSLPQDLTHSIVKQGILLDAATIAIAPPGTGGFSINYLIQVAYQDSDSGSTVLPYYNASNPSVAYSGPANSGTAQPTVRKGVAVVTAKAGTAATTGTQTTPSPDAGKLGLFVVTVANGASTIVNANISNYAGAPLLGLPVMNGRWINRQVITAGGTYVPTPGTSFVDVTVIAGGGGGGGNAITGSGQMSAGAGGGGGGWSRRRLTIAQAIGQTMTVGAAGAGGILGSGAGGNGGASSFGALLSATGGAGGTFGTAQTASNVTFQGSGSGGVGSNGDVNGAGGYGRFATYSPGGGIGGDGGSSYFGGGAPWSSGTSGGITAPSFGSGGGGGVVQGSNGTGAPGGNGGAGRILIDEYA